MSGIPDVSHNFELNQELQLCNKELTCQSQILVYLALTAAGGLFKGSFFELHSTFVQADKAAGILEHFLGLAQGVQLT